MVRPSLLLDTAPRNGGGRNNNNVIVQQSSVSWTYGKITGTSATDSTLPSGWVEVGIPYSNPTSHAVGESDGIATWIGARVLVIIDSSGRVVKISDPIAEPPSGAKVENLGHTGKMLSQAAKDAERAFKEADAIRDRANKAEGAANKAAKDAEKAVQIAEANRPPVVAQTAPENPVTGLIWYVTDNAGHITDVRIWDGTQWVTRTMVAGSILVPSSVGNVSLADGSVSARNIYASGELWAKIAAFASVTTEMLTAGNATFNAAKVTGDLIGNRLIGGELSLVDTEPTSGEKNIRFGLGSEYEFWESIWSPKIATVEELEGGTRFVLTDRDRPNNGNGAQMAIYDIAVAKPKTYGIAGEGVGKVEGYILFTPSWNGRAILTINIGKNRVIVVDEQATAGQKIRFDFTLPDGTWIQDTDTPFYISARTNDVFTPGMQLGIIYSMYVSWKMSRSSGLHIFRDDEGVAKIQITDRQGGQLVMDTNGVAYDPPGSAPPHSSSWRTFTEPPFAHMATNNAHLWTVKDKWTQVPVGSQEKIVRGGMQVDGIEIVIPQSGLYRLDGTTWYRSSWAGYVGGTRVARSNDVEYGVYMYAALNHGLWTALQVTGVRRLNVGDRIALYTYQNIDEGTIMDWGEMTVSWLTY